MKLNRSHIAATVLTCAVAFLAVAPTVFAKPDPVPGPPRGLIYAHDVQYRTVVTPTNLPDHGPFDTIYSLGDDLISVSDAAPGDPDYNGGRWEVRLVTFANIAPTQFTNAEQVLAAADNGEITISDVVRRFVCTLNRIP